MVGSAGLLLLMKLQQPTRNTRRTIHPVLLLVGGALGPNKHRAVLRAPQALRLQWLPQVGGATIRRDAIDDDGDRFVIFRDATSVKTSYRAGCFLAIPRPMDGAWVVDFNNAYNPPCAFLAYTMCPLPPSQNWLKTPVPAGERYIERKS
jgi:hypothetical protein